MSAPDQVTWVECPRDAWQGLERVPATAEKVAHLRNLLAAGFDHLDLGSFVSPKAVPQMADTEAVLESLSARPGVDLLCIIGNERGLTRAAAAKGVTSVGYPLSISDTFQHRNLGRSILESWDELSALCAQAERLGLDLVVYVSMGFGNPYGDPWSPKATAAAVERLRAMGVGRIALADTVGNAGPDEVEAVLAEVTDPAGLGLHLHAAGNDWRPLLQVALRHGVRWFEGALAGVGGCPFAADELVGNLPTERVLPWLEGEGLAVAPDLTALPDLAVEARRLAGLRN
ncbi:MAG: hydroxymethylglutaryl-CoA lyase [Truepera sp.]|jgi:hydroxymethylglutaryl-CoA lyase|nr:hydroxymethylglutaryl-CoA lyase [Truepera sp.]